MGLMQLLVVFWKLFASCACSVKFLYSREGFSYTNCMHMQPGSTYNYQAEQKGGTMVFVKAS